jgi:glycosyltransferase involved in cell wall biosynthesis
MSLEDKFREIDAPVVCLGMKRGGISPAPFFTLVRLLRSAAPDLVHTWMYHADLFGGVATKLAGRFPVLWNIRHSNLEHYADSMATHWVARICARLSPFLPERIVCCAESAQRFHVEMGYVQHKFTIIPNGFDLHGFIPARESQSILKRELALPLTSFLIGLVARFHRQKDHSTFVRAAARLKARKPETHFVLCGDGIAWDNSQLSEWIDEFNLRDCFHLLGRRSDIGMVTSALDIATSSSSCGEAFSNAIGEAMACGVPCVVTDVGDSAAIVGDTGRVVPLGNPSAMAKAWEALIDLGPEGREALGRNARTRIVENFSLKSVIYRYESLFQEVLSNSSVRLQRARKY